MSDIKKYNEAPQNSNSQSLKMTIYSGKILIAWKEAIAVNKEIRDLLTKNGYVELGIFCFALNNDDNAKKWLFDNGYAHLLATINAAEGDLNALKWLNETKFDILYHIARSVEGYNDSKIWLGKKDRLYLALAMEMERVKNQIEKDNNDPHKINP